MILAALVLILFMATDHYTTIYLLKHGAQELNKVVKFFISECGYGLWFAMKLVAVAWIYSWGDPGALYMAAAVFAAVSLWNGTQIIRAKKPMEQHND